MPNTSSIAAITVQSVLSDQHSDFYKNQKEERKKSVFNIAHDGKEQIQESNIAIPMLIHFKPLFNINEFSLDNLGSNACITKFVILNNGSIQCFVYVKKPNQPSIGKKKCFFLSELRSKHPSKDYLKHTKVDYFQKVLGHVDVAWSVDSWRTWNYIKASYREQNKDFFIYEANLLNAHRLVNLGSTIEFVSCYINDNGLYKDTNNGRFYAFQRVNERLMFSR